MKIQPFEVTSWQCRHLMYPLPNESLREEFPQNLRAFWMGSSNPAHEYVQSHFREFNSRKKLLCNLSGTPVRVFQPRYTIAIVYRLVFSCIARYRAIPPQGPLSWGIARLCWRHAASIAIQTTISFLSRYTGYCSYTVANRGLKRH